MFQRRSSRTPLPSRRRGRVAAAVLCAALLAGGGGLTACSSGQPQATQRPATVDGVTVTLLDAGTAPHNVLTFAHAAAEGDVTLKLQHSLSQKLEGDTAQASSEAATAQVEPSAVQLTMPAREVTKPSQEEGTATLTRTLTLGVPTGSREDLNADIATAEGFRQITVGTLDGRATTRTLEAPGEATDTARASVESALEMFNGYPIVLPAEAIGVGARWTVRSSVTLPGVVPLSQTLTYTLRGRTGDRLDLLVDVDRAPSVQQVPDSPLIVYGAEQSGSGTLTVDLATGQVEGSIKDGVTVTLGDPVDDPQAALADPRTLRIVQRTETTTTWTRRA